MHNFHFKQLKAFTLSLLLLLSIIFTMLGEGKIFLFSLLVILSLRITMGGMHRRTFWGCFFFSFGFFLLVIIMGRYFFIPNSVLVGLYIGYIIYILLRAPIPSKARPSMTEATRKKLKGYSIVVVSAWISGCFFFKYGQWKNCLGWTLLLQMIEILVVEGGRWLCQKNE